MTVLRNVGRLWTAGEPPQERVEVVVRQGVVAAVVPAGAAAPEEDEFDCQGRLLTAGLIDAHTHPVYLRPRLEEVAERSRGASYAELAAEGGGILATVRETRAASWAELEDATRLRLREWLRQGTTTVEAKTGYHLDQAGEIGALRLLSRLGAEPHLPALVPTYLRAHALPPELADARETFVREVAAGCAGAREAGAVFCDVFCDAGAFTPAEAGEILGAARAAGLRLRLHADEIELSGGSRLAAELGATSADHLLQVTGAEIRLLADAGTVATLCPVTALAIGRLPPARALVESGAAIALGTDHNPGTSGATSMALIVYLAVTSLHLSIDEALTAATWGGARSLGLPDRGRVRQGEVADLVLWDEGHEGALAWRPGLLPVQVWRRGAAQL